MARKALNFFKGVLLGSFLWLCLAASNLFPPPSGGGGGGTGVSGTQIWTNDLTEVIRTVTNNPYPLVLQQDVNAKTLAQVLTNGTVIGQYLQASNATVSTLASWDAKGTATNAGLETDLSLPGNVLTMGANIARLNQQNNFTASNYFSIPSSYVSLQTQTNVWSGPTNNIDMNVQDQYFASFTATQISGCINKSTKTAQTVTLTLYNLSATNWAITLPQTILTKDGLRQYTVGVANEIIVSVRYHPGSGHTNAVICLNL